MIGSQDHAAAQERTAPGPDTERRRLRVWLLAGWLGFVLCWTPVEAQRGEKLQKALRALRAQGLELVYSPRLVKPELRVTVQPIGSLSEQLEQLLAPHGLTALETETGAFLVIAATEEDATPLVLRGRVHSSHTGTALNGASVRIVGYQPLPGTAVDAAFSVGRSDVVGSLATTGPIGRFRFAGLEPGLYALEAARDDHVVERVSVLVQNVDGGAVTPSVQFDLLPRAFHNDEIAVRASETSLLKETGPSSLSLDREQVAALPRLGNDLFRTLSLLPGVTSSDVSAQPRIRGGRLDELQVVLDGQEIYGGYHLQDYDNGLSVVSADDLAQVDVVAGSFTAANGDRMGGVLDLRTRTPQQRAGRLALSAVNVEASYAGQFANDFGSWQATARRGSVEYVSRLFGEENPSFWDLLAKVDLQLGERQQLRLNGLMAGDSLSFVEVEGVGEEQETDTLDTRYRNDQFWLTHQAVLGQRTLLLTSVSHSDLWRDRSGSESAEEQTLELSDRRQLLVDELRQNWSIQLRPNHSLDVGAAWRSYESRFHYRSSFERELTAEGDEVLPSVPPGDFETTVAGDHFSVFASDRLRLGERLTIEAGLRYDSYSRSLLPAGAQSSVWSPRLAAAYQLSDRTIVRAGWGLYYQSQRAYEVAVEDGQTAPAALERSNQAVLGLEHQFTNSVLSGLRFEAYRRRIAGPRVRFLNAYEPFNVLRELEPDRIGIEALRSRADGIEALLRGRFGQRTQWWFNYSFSRSEDLLRAASGEVRFVDRETDQPHAASLALAFSLPRSWELSLALRYHTGWPVSPSSLRLAQAEDDDAEVDTGDDELEEPESGMLVLTRLNRDRLDDYHRLDLRLSRTWDVSRGELTFFVDVQNVYDRQNISGLDHALEDGELSNSPERWPGIFPSIGVRWTF